MSITSSSWIYYRYDVKLRSLIFTMSKHHYLSYTDNQMAIMAFIRWAANSDNSTTSRLNGFKFYLL